MTFIQINRSNLTLPPSAYQDILEMTVTHDQTGSVNRVTNRESFISFLLCINKGLHCYLPQHISQTILLHFLSVDDLKTIVFNYATSHNLINNLRAIDAYTIEKEALDQLKYRLLNKSEYSTLDYLDLIFHRTTAKQLAMRCFTPEKLDFYFKLGLGKSTRKQLITFFYEYGMLPSMMTMNDHELHLNHETFIGSAFTYATQIIQRTKFQRKKSPKSMGGLRIIPKTLFELTHITGLWLNDGHLRTLPPEIGRLINLRTIQAVRNQLIALPDEIGNLRKLIYLLVQQNQLSYIPATIGQLEQLEDLSMAENQLTFIPPEIVNLKNLKELWAYQNKLSPEEVRKVKKHRPSKKCKLYLSEQITENAQ